MDGWALLLATLAGAILSTYFQKWIENTRASQDRKIWVFRTLMQTRRLVLSLEHVHALNAIPLEFKGSGKEKKILDAWKLYLTHLGSDKNTPTWLTECSRLFYDMMHEMSKSLGYKFSRVELERDVYSPGGHWDIAEEERTIRSGLANILSGKASVPMEIKSFPIDPEAAKNQKELSKELLNWLKNGAVVTLAHQEDHKN